VLVASDNHGGPSYFMQFYMHGIISVSLKRIKGIIKIRKER
jgi:hypothetical protein